MTRADKDGQALQSRPGSKRNSPSATRPKPNGEMPGWTNGLRQLYDQVVDEDLPDSFHDLLARLDDKS